MATKKKTVKKDAPKTACKETIKAGYIIVLVFACLVSAVIGWFLGVLPNL